ncbi:MAG TPA: hypothetical protein VLX32_11415 [Candidatus Acidoferrum sp.]|nr:hypothetical protein [Candidatus Acidoferrum sp.]
MRQWYRQDPAKRTSGQVAVAVITGRPVEEVTQRVGHTRHTTTRELARVLDQYGFLCPHRCLPIKDARNLPKLAIAQVHSTRSSSWHWVAIDNGRIFDGIWGDAYGVVTWPSDFHITSYLPIQD